MLQKQIGFCQYSSMQLVHGIDLKSLLFLKRQPFFVVFSFWAESLYSRSEQQYGEKKCKISIIPKSVENIFLKVESFIFHGFIFMVLPCKQRKKKYVFFISHGIDLLMSKSKVSSEFQFQHGSWYRAFSPQTIIITAIFQKLP